MIGDQVRNPTAKSEEIRLMKWSMMDNGPHHSNFVRYYIAQMKHPPYNYTQTDKERSVTDHEAYQRTTSNFNLTPLVSRRMRTRGTCPGTHNPTGDTYR